MTKSIMGYPSQTACIRDLSAKGLTRSQIAERTGLKYAQIASVLTKPPSKRSAQGNIDLDISPEARHALNAAAKKRRISLSELISQLAEIIGTDRRNDLVTAILDDDEAAQ